MEGGVNNVRIDITRARMQKIMDECFADMMSDFGNPAVMLDNIMEEVVHNHEYDICPACDGSGQMFAKDGVEYCDRCDGQGRVTGMGGVIR